MLSKSINLVILVIAAVGVVQSTRQISNAGLDFIKSFEGFRGNFYFDSAGIKTIGYGHACHSHDCSSIHPPISIAQGLALLRQDITPFENCVEAITPHLDDDKFAALVSFVFNLGCNVLKTSALAQDVRTHNFRAAAAQFGAYVHGGGKVLPGLVRRRNAERALFCKSGGC